MSNCSRSFEYCTVMSSAYSQPPFACAAARVMAATITESHVAQLVPAGPVLAEVVALSLPTQPGRSAAVQGPVR